MNTDAHQRRLTRIAMAGARYNGSMGGDFADYIGNFDHVDFEKHEAGDYRTVIEGAEIRIQAVNVDNRKRPEWVILVRPVSQITVEDPFRRISPPMRSMKDARSEIFSYIANSDGGAVWYW